MNQINVEELTYEELIELNRQIVEQLKYLDLARTHSEMLEFRVGECVRFATGGRDILGTLMKYNKKTVTVVTEHGESWNVSPSFLTKTEPGSVDGQDSRKIISIDEGNTG